MKIDNLIPGNLYRFKQNINKFTQVEAQNLRFMKIWIDLEKDNTTDEWKWKVHLKSRARDESVIDLEIMITQDYESLADVMNRDKPIRYVGLEKGNHMFLLSDSKLIPADTNPIPLFEETIELMLLDCED